MSFDIHIRKRDFSETIPLPGLQLNVDQMTWQAIGGPDRAKITARGDLYAVWDMIDRLRCPVDIYTDLGAHIWWGMVDSVQVKTGALTIGASLDKMVNRIKCIYADVSVSGTSGERAETDWTEDTVSTAEFGNKESIIQLSQGSSESALQRANTALQMWKYPIVNRAIGGNTSAVEATITCRGWWNTLDWIYYANDEGWEKYEDGGGASQDMGDASANTAIAQSFQLSSTTGWKVDNVRVKIKKTGDPTDNFYVNICADSGGDPGAVLTNGYISGSEMSESTEWYTFEMGTKYALALSTTYWLYLARAGSPDGANYYSIDVNEDLGYSNGAFKVYDGATWAARSPDADMLFTVSGIAETSEQVETIITASEQFFDGIDLTVDSGIYANPWRDGDQTALACVMELLEAGTDNDRRMLARVDNNLRVMICEEPAPGTENYLLAADGKLYDTYGNALDPYNYPAGVWAALKDVIPGSVDVERLINPNRVFIEEVIYDGNKGTTIIRERDTSRLMELR